MPEENTKKMYHASKDLSSWTGPGQVLDSWTCPNSDFSSNFIRFGFRNDFLIYFHHDSAWLCMEKPKKTSQNLWKPECLFVICPLTQRIPKNTKTTKTYKTICYGVLWWPSRGCLAGCLSIGSVFSRLAFWTWVWSSQTCEDPNPR